MCICKAIPIKLTHVLSTLKAAAKLEAQEKAKAEALTKVDDDYVVVDEAEAAE